MGKTPRDAATPQWITNIASKHDIENIEGLCIAIVDASMYLDGRIPDPTYDKDPISQIKKHVDKTLKLINGDVVGRLQFELGKSRKAPPNSTAVTNEIQASIDGLELLTELADKAKYKSSKKKGPKKGPKKPLLHEGLKCLLDFFYLQPGNAFKGQHTKAEYFCHEILKQWKKQYSDDEVAGQLRSLRSLRN